MSDLTGDQTVVREAAEKIPGNPQAGLAILYLEFTKGTDPAEQKKWAPHVFFGYRMSPSRYLEACGRSGI